ncbi:hypothetical protein Daus18300_006585 [Diaporthe australafricana]|uniref:Uncharacterized protein n=1 Tax=Diaporthe australafricana TaxID=127596 RepID=A0ABR3WT96_9PEZI
MTGKRQRDIAPSVRNTCQDGEDQEPPRSRVTAIEIEDEDPIDESETRQQKRLRYNQDDAGDKPLGKNQATPKKSSLSSNIIILSPLARDRTKTYQKNNKDFSKRHKKLHQYITSPEKTSKKLREEGDAAKKRIDQPAPKTNMAEEKLQKMMGIATNIIASRDAELNSIKAVKAKLEAELNSVSLVKAKLEAENQAAQKENANLHRQIGAVNDVNAKLRQMLVPPSEKQVIDADVVSKFTRFRSSILALVRRTWTLKLRQEVDVEALSVTQRFVFSGFPINYDRLRCVVFTLLDLAILNSRNYFLGQNFEELENCMRRAETQLLNGSPEENLELVIAWRNAGFKVTESFRDNDRQLSLSVRDGIWGFLSPVQTSSQAAEQQGRESLKAICDSAVELSLMIRQLKDGIWVDSISGAVGQPFSEWKGMAEEMSSVIADKGQKPGSIAYIITGALVKNPKEDLGSRLVLEKAQVAVYEGENLPHTETKM